jgi:hypothetical protein
MDQEPLTFHPQSGLTREPLRAVAKRSVVPVLDLFDDAVAALTGPS